MSILKVSTIQDTSGIEKYLATAWMKVDCTQTTPDILDDGNFSSISDHGSGDHTFNFETPMTNTDYAVVGVPHETVSDYAGARVLYVSTTGGATTTGVRIRTAYHVNSSSGFDDYINHIVIFGGR